MIFVRSQMRSTLVRRVRDFIAAQDAQKESCK